MSHLLVFLQFLLLVALILRSPWDAAIVWIFVALALLIGSFALWPMRRQLKVTPQPTKGRPLITHGIYQKVRHPMYAALLIFAIGQLVAQPDWIGWVLFFGLMGVLILKMNLEEKLLKKAYPDYLPYCKRSHRLIPFIY